jgi:flagellar assembly protein FliH
MASIIRSPEISEEKRKLSTRRSRDKEGVSSAAISDEVAVKTPTEPGAESSGNLKTPDVKDLVEQARLAVLSQFKEEAEEARELGRQRGLREGRLAGSEEAKETFAAEFARIRSIADKLHQTMQSGIRGMEEMAVAIAYEAVCKMIGDIAVTREGIQALVRQAATHVVNAERVVVRLHEADLAILKDAGAADVKLPSGAAMSWVADQGIELGGCVIETDGGELDARLETQMEYLRRALVDARQNPLVPNKHIQADKRKASPDRRKASRAHFSPERRKKPRRRGEM